MIPLGLPNPFSNQVATDSWSLALGHVDELHRDVLDCCRDMLASCRAVGTPTGLLIRGETGSGKTHLITQLRQEWLTDPHTAVVSVPMTTFAGGMWRHVRERMVGDLLKKIPGQNQSGLLRILGNRFTQSASSAAGGGWSLIEIVTGARNAPPLRQLLDKFNQEQPVAYALRVALPRLYDNDPDTAQLARDWLSGQSLAGADLERLGLPAGATTDRDHEHLSREIVLSLCRLAGDKTTLMICLDEVESMQEGSVDTAGLRALTTLVTQLLAESGPRLVVTFVRPETNVLLRKSVEASNLNKMAQYETRLPPLDRWEHIIQLVLARVHAVPDCRAAHGKQADQLWPVGEAFLRKLLSEHKLVLTPRHLFRACAAEFQRLQHGKPVIGPIPPSVRDEALQNLWERRRDKHFAKPAAIHLDKLFGIGLPWLRELTNAPFVRVEEVDERLADVNLVFRPAAAGLLPVGVSFCNQDGRSLWPRLDRLMKQWATVKEESLLARLLLIRSVAEPRSDAANQRFDKLRVSGATVLFVQPQQLAEFAAFEELFTKVKTGALTDFGKPLETAEYCDWAKTNLSSSVKELADLVFGPAEPAAPEVAAVPAAKPAKRAAAATAPKSRGSR